MADLCVVLLLFLFIPGRFCYKPVIILHGILDHASDMEDLASFITQAHPGTNITLIKLYEELESFTPLWKQVPAITERIRPVMQSAKDGVHIIGFSQGIAPLSLQYRLCFLKDLRYFFYLIAFKLCSYAHGYKNGKARATTLHLALTTLSFFSAYH